MSLTDPQQLSEKRTSPKLEFQMLVDQGIHCITRCSPFKCTIRVAIESHSHAPLELQLNHIHMHH